jgi:hypothetical protein
MALRNWQPDLAGSAAVRGRSEPARAYLRAVTGMSETDAHTHISKTFALWKRRSASDWTLDIGLLERASVELR